MFWVGLYGRVSTHDQQTISLQIRALQEYPAMRAWMIAVQVKEVGSGAYERELCLNPMDTARRREIDIVLVWRLDRWGRSLPDLVTALEELNHLGVRFVSLTEALDLTTPTGRAIAGLLSVFTPSNTRSCENASAPVSPMPGKTASGLGGQRRLPSIVGHPQSSIAPASARPRLHGGSTSAHLGAPHSECSAMKKPRKDPV